MPPWPSLLPQPPAPLGQHQERDRASHQCLRVAHLFEKRHLLTSPWLGYDTYLYIYHETPYNTCNVALLRAKRRGYAARRTGLQGVLDCKQTSL